VTQPAAPALCCRACAAPLTQVFADLGATPLANRNLRPGEEAQERAYPLIARICSACLLVQVDDSVPAHDIFTDYDYFSSTSTMWVEHARRYSVAMIERFGLGPGSRIVEIASNDGYLLQHFKAAGIEVLGVDPAANVAAAAIAAGIPTEVAFFGSATARDLVQRGLTADAMAANNVLAHVPDIKDFVAGFAVLLKPHGVATFEFPHILRLIEHVQFDTIYHEHFSYLSLYAVEKILAGARLRVFDVEELPTHGGSLRLYVCHATANHATSERVAGLRAAETAAHLDSMEGYQSFAPRIAAVKASFLAFLDDAKRDGRRVAAYGAAAKGNTFLNVCGVKHPDIIAVYDRATAKQGKLTPGSHIPIKRPSEIETDRPDLVVILPWNLAAEISASMAVIKSWGGQFVVAVPETRVLES
jgi:SAM-dependent methyltransferase